MGVQDFPYLFQAGEIGKVEIKNRIVMAPMGIGGLVSERAVFSERAIDYYERRAIGGTGLIVTGLCLVNSKIEPWEINGESGIVVMDERWKTRNFIRLTERVHDHGCKIFGQLTAGFGRVFPKRLATRAEQIGVQCIAPSAMPLFWAPKIRARELTTDEVDSLVEAFGNAAFIAKSSEFDGIEIHGHEGYLIDQFTSALWNRRKDKYGGDLKGRMRFALSIIGEIQRSAGPDFPILYRYGIEHKIRGGREIEEGIEIAKMLEEAGVQALHVDAGCYDNWYWPHPPIYQPPGCMVDMAEKIKPHVRVPVITVGRLGYPELADSIIKRKVADFVALGRPLLADPDFARKASRGKCGEIRPCIGCHKCLARLHREQSLACAVNPECGDERRLAIVPAPRRRKIMVVGGGISGMEAARVCSLRGHNVTLFEKGERLGGLLNVASIAEFKEDIRRLVEFQINQLDKLANLQIRLNSEVTAETLRAEKPEVLILATGSVASREADIEGLEKNSFATAEDVYAGKIPEGQKAFVIGGGSVGCETALYLAQKGWSVVVAEMLSSVASDLFEANRTMLLALLKENGVEVLTETKVTRVDPSKVYVETREGQREFQTDVVILAAGRKAVTDLTKLSKDLVHEVVTIGDCNSPRSIKNAIWEAYKIGRII